MNRLLSVECAERTSAGGEENPTLEQMPIGAVPHLPTVAQRYPSMARSFADRILGVQTSRDRASLPLSCVMQRLRCS